MPDLRASVRGMRRVFTVGNGNQDTGIGRDTGADLSPVSAAHQEEGAIPMGKRAGGVEEAAVGAMAGTASDSGQGEATGAEAPVANPRSLAISQRGIRTGDDFANLMSALMSDVIEGALNPVVVNAAVNAGGKLLKVVEMEHRYGPRGHSERPQTMTLATGSEVAG